MMASVASSAVIQEVLKRLQEDEELPLPSRFACSRHSADGPDESDVHDHLQHLLLSEPGIFLERYGTRLRSHELEPFDSVAGAIPCHADTCQLDVHMRFSNHNHQPQPGASMTEPATVQRTASR
jgi:hypothetical protein